MRVFRILLIEDNRGDVLLIREALAAHSIRHELQVVSDGAEAMRAIQAMGNLDGPPCPDVVLLDLNLPKADGIELLTELRRQERSGDLPVIVVTSSGVVKDKARAAALGVSHYFQKPADFEEFLRLGELVRSVLEVVG